MSFIFRDRDPSDVYGMDLVREISENPSGKGDNMTNLKRIRKESKLTQKALSELSGVNQRLIQHYEQGFRDINNAQALTLYNLAKALCCSMEDLIEIKKETEE